MASYQKPSEVAIFWDYQNCLMQKTEYLEEAIDYVRNYCERVGLCEVDAHIKWHVVYMESLREKNEKYAISNELHDELKALANNDEKESFLAEKNVSFVVKGAVGLKESVDDRELRELFSRYMLSKLESDSPVGCVMITGDKDFLSDVRPIKEHIGNRLFLGWLCRPGAPPSCKQKFYEITGGKNDLWYFDSINSRIIAEAKQEHKTSFHLDLDDSDSKSEEVFHICEHFAESRCSNVRGCNKVHLDPNFARRSKIVDIRKKDQIIAYSHKPICWHFINKSCSFGDKCTKLHMNLTFSRSNIVDVRENNKPYNIEPHRVIVPEEETSCLHKFTTNCLV